MVIRHHLLQISHIISLMCFIFKNFFLSGFLHNAHSVRLAVFSGLADLDMR